MALLLTHNVASDPVLRRPLGLCSAETYSKSGWNSVGRMRDPEGLGWGDKDRPLHKWCGSVAEWLACWTQAQ